MTFVFFQNKRPNILWSINNPHIKTLMSNYYTVCGGISLIL